MKLIKFFLAPETLLLIAIFVTTSGAFPKTVVPFAFMLIGGIYLLYVFIRAVKKHGFKPSFGAVSIAFFFFVFGICLLFTHNHQVFIPIGIAFAITFIAQIVWSAWENKFSN